MYLCGFLRLDLGICAQDLNKLGDVELNTLRQMAAVFAEQAGDGAPGSRIAVEKRLVPSRSISRGWPFGGAHLEGFVLFFCPFHLRIQGPEDRQFRRQGAAPGPCGKPRRVQGSVLL